MVSPDALGITHISDLSTADMEKVRSVALLELTVTFDDHDVPLPVFIVANGSDDEACQSLQLGQVVSIPE